MRFGLISVAAGDQVLGHGNHFSHMAGGARLDRRLEHAELGDVLVELPGGLGRHLGDRHALFRRAGINLVVDVGDVARIGDVVRAIDMAQQAEQNIEYDDRTGIADMRVVVDRRPADIHAHIARIIGLEGALLARQGIVKR